MEFPRFWDRAVALLVEGGEVQKYARIEKFDKK